MPFRALILLRWTSRSPASSTWPSAQPHWPGLEAMPVRSWPAGTAPLEDCQFWCASSFHHISSEFSLIVFGLKSLQSPQKSGWPLLVSQRQCAVGLLPLWVPCAVSEHCADQFIVGCIVDNMGNARFARTMLGRCLDDARSPRRGSPPPASRRGTSCCLPCAEGLSVAGASLRVGSGAPRLVFSLLVLGLSLAPALVVLVPVVPRDTRGSAPTGKYVAGFDDEGRGHGPRNQAAF